MRVAGVSIEDSFLRISITDKKFGVIRPVKSEDISLPLTGQERSSAIKEAFHKIKEKYKTADLVMGLSLKYFSHHVIDMPLLSRSDMRNALTFELEKRLPLSPDEYIFDFFTIEKSKDRKKVLVLSVMKDRLSGLLSAVKETGLNLLAVRCSLIEAVNEFVKASKAKVAATRDRDAIFVYTAEDAFQITGIKDGKPVFFNTVSKGKDIISEIERLSGSFKGGIYLSGAREAGLLEKINAKTVSLSLSYAIALSVLRKPPVKLNFIPSGILPEKKDYYPYAIGALASLAVILFFLTEIYSYYKDYYALKKVENRIENIKAKTSGLLEARKKLETITEQKKFLYDFRAKRNIDIKVLTELSRILPKDTWLIGLSIDERGRVDIEGFSNRAAGTIEMLNKSKLFKKIEFAAPVLSQDDKEKFSIRMEIAG